MRNLKRALSLALAMVMVLSMMVIGGSAAGVEFTDQDELTYPEAAAVMSGLDVIEGIPDGNGGLAFTPDKILSRAEAAVMLTRFLMGRTNADKLSNNTQIFVDVPAAHYAAGSIAYCANLKYIEGWDGYFNPDQPLTGSAWAKLLLVAAGYDPAVEGFANVGDAWEQNVATVAIANGVDIDGVPLADPVTREQAVQMMFQLLDVDVVDYKTEVFGGVEKAFSTGVTVSEKYYPDLAEFEGVVTANEYADLYSDEALRAGKTKFDDSKVLDVSTTVDDIGESRRGWALDDKVLYMEDTGKNVTVSTSADQQLNTAGRFKNFAGVNRGDAEEFINFAEQDVEWFESNIRIVYSLNGTGNDLVSIRPGERTDIARLEEIEAIFRNDNYIEGWVVVGTTYQDADTAKADDISNTMPYREFEAKYIEFEGTDNTTQIDANENGNWLKVIDNDNDGEADYVLQITFWLDEVYDIDDDEYDFDWYGNPDDFDVALTIEGEIAEDDVVVCTAFDGNMFVKKAEVAAETIKSMDYKAITVTTTDGDTYGQSWIGNGTGYEDDITLLDDKVSYELFLDWFGYVAAYRLVDEDAKYALLTETYTTDYFNQKYYRNSVYIAEYTIGDARTNELPVSNYGTGASLGAGSVFFEAADSDDNELVEATAGLGVAAFEAAAPFASVKDPSIFAATNVADYSMGEDEIALYSAAERATRRDGTLLPYMAVDYVQIDDSESVAAGAVKYPVADVSDNLNVNATHETEYYLVTPNSIVYFTDYVNLPAIPAEDILVAYAVASDTRWDAADAPYWVADVVVFEVEQLLEDYDDVGLVYYNNSKDTDRVKKLDALKAGSPEEVTTFYIDEQAWNQGIAGKQWTGLAFYEMYADRDDADLYGINAITDDWNDYGIYAGVIDRVTDVYSKGDYIQLTAAYGSRTLNIKNVPVYTLSSYTQNNGRTVIEAEETTLRASDGRRDGNEGDPIIYVYDGNKLAYIVLAGNDTANDGLTAAERNDAYPVWEDIDDYQGAPTTELLIDELHIKGIKVANLNHTTGTGSIKLTAAEGKASGVRQASLTTTVNATGVTFTFVNGATSGGKNTSAGSAQTWHNNDNGDLNPNTTDSLIITLTDGTQTKVYNIDIEVDANRARQPLTSLKIMGVEVLASNGDPVGGPVTIPVANNGTTPHIAFQPANLGMTAAVTTAGGTTLAPNSSAAHAGGTFSGVEITITGEDSTTQVITLPNLVISANGAITGTIARGGLLAGKLTVTDDFATGSGSYTVTMPHGSEMPTTGGTYDIANYITGLSNGAWTNDGNVWTFTSNNATGNGVEEKITVTFQNRAAHSLSKDTRYTTALTAAGVSYTGSGDTLNINVNNAKMTEFLGLYNAADPTTAIYAGQLMDNNIVFAGYMIDAPIGTTGIQVDMSADNGASDTYAVTPDANGYMYDFVNVTNDTTGANLGLKDNGTVKHTMEITFTTTNGSCTYTVYIDRNINP